MQTSIKKNSILNIIKTISTILFPLITFPYVSRTLLPDNIGKVNFATTYVGYFALIASLGVSTYAIRECASKKKCKEELSDVASQIYSINIITTLLAYLILFLSFITVNKIEGYKLLILIYSVTIVSTTLGADWINSAMEDFKYITIRSIGFQFLSLLLLFLLVRNENDYYKYVIILVVSSAGASISNIFYRKKYCNIHFTFHIEWKRHMGPILALFAMTMAATIMNSTDITMLGFMKGDYEVGLYSTAHKVINIIAQFVQSIIYVLIPRLSFYFANADYVNINKLLRKLLSFNIMLGLPLVIGTIMMSSDIMYVVGGQEYIAATPLLSILIISFLFSLVGGSFLGNGILIPSKKEKYYMIVCCITAVVNIILNLILIPPLGAVGASIATAANGFLIFVLLLFKIDKRVKIDNISDVFLAPTIGTILVGIVCWLGYNINSIWIRIIFDCSLSILLYFCILRIFKYELLMDLLNPIRDLLKRRENNDSI